MKKIAAIIAFLLTSMLILGSYTNDNVYNNDDALKKAILENIQVKSDENRYVTFYEDINGGTNCEVLVYLWGPDFSKSEGDTLVILDNENGEYKFISKTTSVNMPIIISNSKTNGFNDIIVYVTGGNIKNGFYSVLKNEDGKYPLNSSIQPQINLDKIYVRKLINTNISSYSGEKLQL